MSKTINVSIDGRKIEVPFDARVLDVARKMGIEIPTMCENENLAPYGVCRVCLVEMRRGRRKKLVASCVYTFREEVEIFTDSEWVRKTRRWILEFMLARSPGEKAVVDLAAKYGVTQPHPRLRGNAHPSGNRFESESACVLCGMCVRTCEEVVGAGAIAYQGRGIERRVAAPFNENNDACIACGACEFVCPTKCIGFLDHGGTRELLRWRKETKMIACKNCGDYFLPESLAKVYAESMNIPESVYTLCTDCRKSVFA